jgi:hypothetical protein
MATYFGTLTGFTLPYTNISSDTLPGGGQSYLNDLEYVSGVKARPSGSTPSLSFIAIGSSRLSELKKYGTTGYTQTLEYGTISGVTYTGYTIDGLSYRDLANGFTQITGQTANYYSTIPSGYTTGDATNFATEYVINKVLTRNEHFLGFIEQPRVYSDVFVERGKQGVMEMNFRLGEIDNMGELSVYGNGFFNVKKQ